MRVLTCTRFMIVPFLGFYEVGLHYLPRKEPLGVIFRIAISLQIAALLVQPCTESIPR